MALRSVIDLDIDTSSVDRAMAKIAKFQEASKALPKLSLGGGLGAASGLPGARGGQTAEERAVPNAEKLVRAWGQMRDHSREVTRNVTEMSKRFLSLTGWLSALSGAATGFGFLGFNSLAGGAAGLRQQSMSAFTTPGGLQAARIALGRFGDVNSMLSGLGTAAQTPGSEGWKSLMLLRGQAQRMGLQSFDLKPGEDSETLLEKVLPALQGVMQRTNPQMRGMMFQQLGLDKILGSFSQAQQLIGRTPEELQTQIGEARRMRPGLEIPGARAFQDFTSKVEEAGAVIKTTLTNQVAALAGPLGNLTQQITGLLTAFIKWAATKENIDLLAHGIQTFANALKNEDWAGDWRKFKDGLDEAITALDGFVGFVKRWLPGAGGGGDTKFTTDKPGAGPGDIPLNPFRFDFKNVDPKKWLDPFGDSAPDITIPLPGWLQKQDDPSFFRPRTPSALLHPSAFRPGDTNGVPIRATAAIPVEIVGFRGFSDQKKEEPQAPQNPWASMVQQASFRVPADDMNAGDLISRIAKVESGFNPMAVSSAGAQGLMQFMPKTWAQYGQGSPFNPMEAIRAAQRYLGHLFSLPELGGDPAKVVASYNAGEGSVIASIKKFGADWLSHLPQETQAYVPKVLGGTQSTRPDFHPVKPPHVGVTIQNETGGNVVTTHRLLAT